jgi:hypothetical protein
MGNLTFNAGNTTPAASTQNIVQSGVTQYQLSTSNTNFGLGDIYYGAGAAFTAMTRLALASGAGSSVLIRSDTAPVWGTIQLGSANFVSGTLPVTNGGLGAATFTANGILYGNTTGTIQVTGAAANAILVTSGANVPSLSTDIPTAVTIGTAYIYRVGGNDVSLADGGTNNSLIAVTGAVAYSDASKIVLTNAGNGGSVLISNGTNPLFSAINLASSNAVTGVLPIANGGSNASSFTNTNGAVIFDGTRLVTATGTTITSGVGISVNGTMNSAGGFFTGGNSVVTNVAGIYGSVGFTSQASNGGTSFIQVSGQSLILNYPGTGITGTGAITQVPYYNAARELTGDVGLVYSRTAATGIGLSLNINATTGTILQVNSAQAMTSGLLFDVNNNGSQRFAIDFKGMATHTVGSGNTGLILVGGRSVLSAATANYSTVNLPSSSGTNPGAGITQIGDLWFNGTNLYFRKDATTSQDLLIGSVSGSGIANRIVKWNTSSSLTNSNITDAGTGMTITATTAVGVGLGSTAYLTIQSLSGDEAALIKNSAYFVRGIDSTNARMFSVDVAGNLRATTKSFDIPHPTKEGMRLVYGVLEGPEHGVYHRGTVEGKGIIQINLPDYWHKLVGDQYTIQLTPWGNYNVCIESKTENYFTIQLVGDLISRKFKKIKVDYIVHGSRIDAPLETEQ